MIIEFGATELNSGKLTLKLCNSQCHYLSVFFIKIINEANDTSFFYSLLHLHLLYREKLTSSTILFS